jgi:hypothetical protein
MIVFFSGRSFHHNSLENFCKTDLGRSENDWMDSKLFYTWVSDICIPAVEYRGVKKHIVIFVDGLATFLNLHVSDLCKAHDIVLN